VLYKRQQQNGHMDAAALDFVVWAGQDSGNVIYLRWLLTSL
jgi:hypothetical protein